jgi:hypothetical protein
VNHYKYNQYVNFEKEREMKFPDFDLFYEGCNFYYGPGNLSCGEYTFSIRHSSLIIKVTNTSGVIFFNLGHKRYGIQIFSSDSIDPEFCEELRITEA